MSTEFHLQQLQLLITTVFRVNSFQNRCFQEIIPTGFEKHQFIEYYLRMVVQLVYFI